MPVEIPIEAKKQYLDYFRDPKRFKIPSRDPHDYNIADDFFNNLYEARMSLESLLDQILPFPEPTTALDQDSYTEFVVTGHSEVRKALGQPQGVKILVGQTDLMLVKGEEGTKKAIEQGRYADHSSLVISSDLARAIHHGVLKYSPEMEDLLDGIANVVDEEIKTNSGVISRDTHTYLIELALDFGIIPTPLLRSHYHGMRDLNPERWKEFDIDAFLKTSLCEKIYQGKSKEEVRDILIKLKEYAKHGKDVFQFVEDEKGKTLTEDLPLYAHRVVYLLKMFAPRGIFYEGIKGKKIELIGHSSNIDIVPAYFRHFDDESKFVLEKADKSKTRGAEVVIKVDSDFVYLNDPKRLEPIIKETEREIRELRLRSVDTLIRERGEGILETPLLGLRLKEKDQRGEEKYEEYKETLEEALKSEEPIIIFGHGGQGKSILATEIAKKFLEGKFGEAYKNYIPLILNCDGINESAHKNREAYGNTRIESVVKKLINKEKLPAALLKEYKFVFIIDDFQKLNPDYKKTMDDLLHDLRKEENLVIALSRREREDIQPYYSGYKNMRIDTESIAKQSDEFTKGRIDPEYAERFKEYLQQYDTSITGYYQTKLFLTRIFPTGDGENKRVSDYVIDDSIREEVEKGKPLTRTQLYEAFTDYQCGCDIQKIHNDLGIKQVREEIVRWKNSLAEKAYNDTFGKGENGAK